MSHHYEGTNHFDQNRQYFKCSNCGLGYYPSYGGPPNRPCSSYTVTDYGIDCGHEDGEIVRTTTDFNEAMNLTANERLVKVEITY